MALDRIAAMNVPGMYKTVLENRISMCGYGPTAVTMLYAESCHVDMLCQIDSYDSLRINLNAVVGYASAVFS